MVPLVPNVVKELSDYHTYMINHMCILRYCIVETDVYCTAFKYN